MSTSYLSPSDIETLLRMSESTQLDFKGGQYDFAGADQARQAELLKDILAFANAWKTSDAFILIGVEDTRSGRAKVVGVAPHLDDHSIQQFVNQKTNVPIAFEYIATEVDGHPIGIIRVAKDQPRPVFLLKKFAMLDANRVYIRRGSSTDEADPEEIAKMGEARGEAQRAPSALLLFGEPKSRKRLDPPTLVSKVVPEVSEEMKGLMRAVTFKLPVLRDFDAPSEEAVAEYEREKALLNELAFVFENTGGVLVQDVRIRARIPRHDGLIVRDREPSGPKRAMSYAVSALENMRVRGTTWTEVTEAEQGFEVDARIPKVQPGTRGWADSIWIGSSKMHDISIACIVSADNLPKPIHTTMNLRIEALTPAPPVFVSDEDVEEMLASGVDVEDEP